MSHKGLNYVVIGANGGMGSVTTKMLLKAGAQVMLLGRNEKALEALSKETSMPFYVADATDINAIDEVFIHIKKKCETIHGVVNCVGSILLRPAHLLTEKDWNETIATNLTSAFSTVRAASKYMIDSGGSVVLISAAAALIGLPNHEAISATKAGVNGLMQSAAATYASKNLRFNCVAPGLVNTTLSKHIIDNPKALEVSLRSHPLGRVGQPEDIARLIIFLLDPENDWITGQTIAIDGGLSSIKKL